MANYVIGDIQGCYTELLRLLSKIQFKPEQDKLIFVGDLVNRGPSSLDVLRFVKGLGESAVVLLGNHDLYLLAVAYGYLSPNEEDTINSILKADDRYTLIEWLRQKHFIYIFNKNVVTHAGVPAVWSLEKARLLDIEINLVLKDDNYFKIFIENLFLVRKKPLIWKESLKHADRWCCIANYFTRMRFCNKNNLDLDFSFKGKIEDKPKDLLAWFNIDNPGIDDEYTLIFGHWSALNGVTNSLQHIAIDTGCVWGKKLSAYCMDTKRIYQVDSDANYVKRADLYL